ncbi:MAG TPA: dTDP-4-dehydrorhamnose reductase [Piscirickettsiaceae bacterium]|jgi:dTDP-4-dehydrorhamnose reductase|nr:dTDP-4-dehydrorhamnose reductase [Piscirickettsiaceae bacterium]
MRILVTGKNGQLGRSIHKVVNITNSGNQLSNEFIFVGREELDLSDENNINNYFYNNGKFDVIINCAAYTAVDRAEEEQALANQVNHLAVKQLATVANRQKAKLISLSTDYVFDGESDKPYAEKDEVNPINVYGKTKLAGEDSIQKIMPTDAIIIRTSWVYSEYGNNFVSSMLRLGKERSELSVVNDQIGSPTYAADLVEMILTIIDHESFRRMGQKTQIYHYSNAGKCSWYEFAKEIFSLKKIECRVSPITTDQYKTLARRPKCSLLDNKKIEKKFSIKLKHWKDSLSTCLNRV